jgi:1-acyl-sn-glycerol-3-phosphate acyltransferase
MRLGQVSSIQFLGPALLLILFGGLLAAQSAQVPVVDGALGSCRADFTVKDGSDKPIYNAKIHVLIKYGFFSKRKTELEVGTNSDGKAGVTGLPNAPKRPLEFTIRSGTVEKTVTDDPSDNCNAKFDVTLSVH